MVGYQDRRNKWNSRQSNKRSICAILTQVVLTFLLACSLRCCPDLLEQRDVPCYVVVVSASCHHCPFFSATSNGRGSKRVENLFCLHCQTGTLSPTLSSDGLALHFVSAFLFILSFAFWSLSLTWWSLSDTVGVI